MLATAFFSSPDSRFIEAIRFSLACSFSSLSAMRAVD
jgi:hypothetical protein